MPTSNSVLPSKSSNIKQDDKLSSGRLTREVSVKNSSSEVYYGGVSVAVPFMWESQPGTPKVRFREAPLPPLTPPPSFISSPVKKPIRKCSKSINLLHTLLPKLTSMRKTHFPPSPASSSSSSSSSSSPWSSSHSVPSSPFTPNLHQQLRLPSSRSLFDSRISEEDGHGSPVSTSCFGFSRGMNAMSRGWSSSISKVFLGYKT